MPPAKKGRASAPTDPSPDPVDVPDVLTTSERAMNVLSSLKELATQIQALDDQFIANGGIPGLVVGTPDGASTYEVERSRRVQAQEWLVTANADLMPVVNALIQVQIEQDAQMRGAV